MKTNKLTLLAAMLAMVLVVGSSALAQVAEETNSDPAQPPPEEITQAPEETASAPAQAPTETIQAPEETISAPAQAPATTPAPVQETPAAPAAPPKYTLSADGQSLIIDGTVEVPCADIFRDEQAELAAIGEYPTVASDEARACEDFGLANPFPAPYFYDTEGFLYTFDPVADRYTAPDPATGLLYIYDLVTDTFYTYNPASGTYV